MTSIMNLSGTSDLLHQIRRLLKPIHKLCVDYWWQVLGNTIKNPALPATVSSIVFICKGNICRSAFAHHFGQQLMGKQNTLPILSILSAGLEAHPGSGSPITAIEVAREFGVDLEQHRSVLLDEKIVCSADMLVAMEPGQVLEIMKKYPYKKANTYLLPLFEDRWDTRYFGWKKYHLQDPYGKEKKDFFESFIRVKKCVEKLFTEIN